MQNIMVYESDILKILCSSMLLPDYTEVLHLKTKEKTQIQVESSINLFIKTYRVMYTDVYPAKD